MKYFTQLLIFSVFFSIMFSCSDSDDTEKKVLATYTAAYSGYDHLLLIADINGNLIDSARSTSTEPVELSGPVGTDKFNFLKIRVSENALIIFLYSHTYNQLWNDRQIPDSKFENYVNLNFDEDIVYQYGVSGYSSMSHTDDRLTQPFRTSRENKVSVVWTDFSFIPKFALYSDLINNTDLNINAADFSAMSFKAVESDYDWDASITGLYSKNSFYGYYMGNYNKDYHQGVYFASDFFNIYRSNFRFNGHENSLHSVYETTYYGDIPNRVERLEIGDLTIPKTFENYTAGSSNVAVDIIENEYYDSNNNYLVVYSPNNEKIEVEKLLDLIQDIFPNRNMSLDRWSSTWVIESDGQTYDEYLGKSGDKKVIKTYDLINID